MESLKMLKSMMVPFHRYKCEIKSWGFEYWFENNDKYCGKIIQARAGEWSSHGAFHYHKVKDETFLVLSGTLLLDILPLDNISRNIIGLRNEIVFTNEEDEKDNIYKTIVLRYMLEPYQYIRLRPGILHRFSALEGEVLFTETSTTHREEDSFRIKYPTAEDQLALEVKHIHDDVMIVPQAFSYKFETPKEKEKT